jgi:hypothetical protein
MRMSAAGLPSGPADNRKQAGKKANWIKGNWRLNAPVPGKASHNRNGQAVSIYYRRLKQNRHFAFFLNGRDCSIAIAKNCKEPPVNLWQHFRQVLGNQPWAELLGRFPV